MSFLIAIKLTILSFSVVSAQLVQNPPAELSQESTNTTDTDPPLLLGPINGTDALATLQWTNATNATSSAALNMEYSCSGQMCGFNLRWQSCIDALEQIKLTDPTLHTYGYRDRGQWDFNVPQRWISSDGLCSVDADLDWGKSSCWSSEQLIGRGGVTVLRECVGQGKGPNTGGVARRIDGDNSLQVSLSKQTLGAVCYGRMSSALQRSCKSIVDGMPLDDILRTFGSTGGQGRTVKLPYTLVSRDRKCAMTIKTTGSSDKAKWWQFWEAAVQLTGVCVRGGKGGKTPGIGSNKRLSIELVNPLGGVSAS